MAEKCFCGGIIVAEAAYKDHSCFENVPFWGSLAIREINPNRIGRRYCIECNDEKPL